jgi:hypothetical protein
MKHQVKPLYLSPNENDPLKDDIIRLGFCSDVAEQ